MQSVINTDQQMGRFFNLCSYAGLKAIYAMKLSFEKSVPFSREDFAKDAYFHTSDYFYGFIVACAAIDIFAYKIKNGIITVTDFDTNIASKIDEAMKKRAEQNELWPPQIQTLEKYFQ